MKADDGDLFGGVQDLREWASAVVRERVPHIILAHEARRTVCETCDSGDREEVPPPPPPLFFLFFSSSSSSSSSSLLPLLSSLLLTLLLFQVLLLCDNCGLGFHIDCLRPPLAAVPPEDWFCPLCIDYDYVDSDEEREHEQAVWRVPDDVSRPLGNVFVNQERVPCSKCRQLATRFVVPADQAAPVPGSVPSWPPPGIWYCDACALEPIEAAWSAQMAALQALRPDWPLPETQVPAEMPAEALEPAPKRTKRAKKHAFGPARELLLAYAMELAGALESRFVDWNLIEREFFPETGARKLLKRYENIVRKSPASHPVNQLELRRPPKLKKRHADRVVDFLAHSYPALRRAIQPTLDEGFGLYCMGCAKEICGTLLQCRLCKDARYCLSCYDNDPSAHEPSHWRDADPEQVCDSCRQPAVGSNLQVAYCEACVETDPLQALAAQWRMKHKRIVISKLRKQFDASPSILKDAIERVRLVYNPDDDPEENPYQTERE